jgi:hypothetical protein
MRARLLFVVAWHPGWTAHHCVEADWTDKQRRATAATVSASIAPEGYQVMISVTRKPQPASTTASTRAKAATLEILNMSRSMAIVAGTHDDYMVDFDTLTCTCRAGRDGLHCSHVLAAISERAHLHGYERVEFFDDAAAAIAFTVAELVAGRKPRRQSICGYHWVETQTGGIVGKLVIDDTVPGKYSVWDEGGHVFGSSTTYLAADARRKAIRA